MSADWYPGIRTFCTHWNHAPMLQQTFEALEREFNENSDACIDAAKAIVVDFHPELTRVFHREVTHL